eukprot:IDg14909t1
MIIADQRESLIALASGSSTYQHPLPAMQDGAAVCGVCRNIEFDIALTIG